MQEYAIKKLKWFLETIGPFRHLWQSVLVRATWSHLDGEDRILSISITLESLAPKLLRPPAVRPDVGPLRTAWQAFDIAHLESLVDEFATGSIQVEGRKLLLESHTGSKWDKWSSLHQAFDRPEGSPYSTSRLPTVRVHDFNSGSSSAYESVTDSALALQLRALHVPFENMQDVLESFLGIPRSQRDQNLIIVSIRAEIPIHFGEASIHDGKLKAKVSMPKRADLQKVSVGLIESAPDRVIRRSTVPIAPKTWKKVGDQWQASIDQSAAPGTTKALLFLNYSGIFIGQKSVIALQSDSGNPGMRLHELLDRDNQQLLKCLAGQGKRRDEHFEQAVSWLFGFCGFHTQLYAHFPPVEEEAVDLIAYLKEAAVILGIECTISHPQTLGKMPKLVTRCRRMEETVKDLGLEVIPVLATALDEVSQSEIETAAHDGISLLTQKDLLKLLQLAGAGAQPTAILRHIRSRITNKDAGPFGAQFG